MQDTLLNSVENGAIGFRNYIPMSVFKKYNFDTKLTALANMQIGGGDSLIFFIMEH